MPNASQLRGKYVPQSTPKRNKNKQSAHSSDHDEQSIVSNRETSPREIREDLAEIQQIPTAETRGTLFSRPLLILLAAVVLLLVAAAVVIPLVYSLTSSTVASSTWSLSTMIWNTTSTTATTQTSTTVTTTTTTTSTTVSTTTTTAMDPCSTGNMGWNSTGITVLGSPTLTLTSSVYLDANDTLYMVDETTDHVVWKLLRNSSTPIHLAGLLQTPGSNASQFNYPQDAYVDSNQNLYVVDCNNHRVQKFSNGSPNGVTIAGITGSTGSALNQLANPRYFLFDSTETYFYVADTGNNRILRFAINFTSGANGTVVAGGNGAGNANNQLNAPWGAHYPSTVSTFLYITTWYGHTVMRWAPGAASGTVVAGSPGLAGSNSTLLNLPLGIKVDTYLNMFVVDSGNHRVQMFCQNSLTGITIAGTGVSGNAATQLNGPRGIAFDSHMNLYIGDIYNSRVQKFVKL